MGLVDSISNAIDEATNKTNAPHSNPNVNNVKVVSSTPKSFYGNATNGNSTEDYIGIVIAREGAPLTEGDIASRIGGFKDIQALEANNATDEDLIAEILKTKNNLHNNYQDAQAFLKSGGQVGMQHDPLLYGAYRINPASFTVMLVPMLVVEQGEVAVIKAYVGNKGRDTSGEVFRFGELVRPGDRGVWRTPLRTGKYAINPKCYEAVMVKTSIINLNWADAISSAHQLDARLSSIHAKSKEGFELIIDLQVQIHIPDTEASKVISSVGTMQNLIDDILQAAVGNHFRDRLQSMSAVAFINDRQKIQEEAFSHIKEKLTMYGVETVGVYIQNVIYPDQLIKVLQDRELANQQKDTYKSQEAAQLQRIDMEAKKGTADKQAELAASQVGIDIADNNSKANIKKAEGDSKYTQQVGFAEADVIKQKQLAEAAGYVAKVNALGAENTALVTVLKDIAASQTGIKIMPETVIMGGGGGAMEGFFAKAMGFLNAYQGVVAPKKQLDAASDEDNTTDPMDIQDTTM